MEIQINRHLAIPIYTQIVGQMKFGIVSGYLPSGSRLPSIRDLAQALNIAPMTVSQAYQEVKQLGLIEMQPGRGTFVADFDLQQQEPLPNRTLQLRRILQRSVVEAQGEGFSADEIYQVFLPLLNDTNGRSGHHYFVLAGLFANALRVYADDIERDLAAQRVVVEPVTFDELESRPDYYAARLRQAEALLAPLHQVQTLRRFLHTQGIDRSSSILGLGFCLRPSARQAIQALPPGLRIGLLSLYPEFVNTLIQGVAAAYPSAQEWIVCLAHEPGGLQHMAESAQAIVYASGSNQVVDRLRPQLSANVPLIEYLHTPTAAAYQHIRQLIATPQVHAPGSQG